MRLHFCHTASASLEKKKRKSILCSQFQFICKVLFNSDFNLIVELHGDCTLWLFKYWVDRSNLLFLWQYKIRSFYTSWLVSESLLTTMSPTNARTSRIIQQIILYTMVENEMQNRIARIQNQIQLGYTLKTKLSVFVLNIHFLLYKLS